MVCFSQPPECVCDREGAPGGGNTGDPLAAAANKKQATVKVGVEQTVVACG